MNSKIIRFLLTVLFLTGSASLIMACSVFKIAEIGAVREANELAITCKTDEALASVNRAVQDGGLGASIGDLQRVVILRDVGRTAEATAAMVERNMRWNAEAKNVAEAEDAVTASMEELRAERQERTGHRTCN